MVFAAISNSRPNSLCKLQYRCSLEKSALLVVFGNYKMPGLDTIYASLSYLLKRMLLRGNSANRGLVQLHSDDCSAADRRMNFGYYGSLFDGLDTQCKSQVDLDKASYSLAGMSLHSFLNLTLHYCSSKLFQIGLLWMDLYLVLSVSNTNSGSNTYHSYWYGKFSPKVLIR